MLLGALAFALGARRRADAVRRGAARAFVSLAFEPSDALRERLAADGFELDPDEDATIEREMPVPAPRSARINGRAARAGYLREIGDADCRDRRPARSTSACSSPAYHADARPFCRRRRARRRGRPRVCIGARDAARAARTRRYRRRRTPRAARYEDAKFSFDEIDARPPQPGEDAERTSDNDICWTRGVSTKRSRPLPRGRMRAMRSAPMRSAPPPQRCRRCVDLRRTFSTLAQVASALQSEVDDLAAHVGRALDEVEGNPAELEAINARLDALDKLKRKYGGSLERVLEAADAARPSSAYEHRDERAAELRADRAARAKRSQSRATLSQLGATPLHDSPAMSPPNLKTSRSDRRASNLQLVPLDAPGARGAERAEFALRRQCRRSRCARSRASHRAANCSRVLLALSSSLAAARDARRAHLRRNRRRHRRRDRRPRSARASAVSPKPIKSSASPTSRSWRRGPTATTCSTKAKSAAAPTISVREVTGADRELPKWRACSRAKRTRPR